MSPRKSKAAAPQSVGPVLDLRVLGGFELRTIPGGRAVRLTGRKSRALLGHLAVGGAGPRARERLAALLWEEAGEALARSSLRQALASLRRELPAAAREAVVADSQEVHLDRRLVEVDAGCFERAVAEGTRAGLERALALYGGPLLDGVDARSGAFDDWLRGERASWHRRAVELARRLHALMVEAGEEGDAVEAVLARWVALEPVDEHPRRLLMEALARRGRNAEALEEYRRLKDALARELGVAPEAKTEEVQREILMRRRGMGRGEVAAGAGTGTGTGTGTVGAAGETVREGTILAVAWGVLGEEGVDPEEAGRMAVALEMDVKGAVEGLGGKAGRVIGGQVLGAFGVGEARGDENERAVRAALAVRAAVAARGWAAAARGSLGIGLAQGPVVAAAGDGDGVPVAGRPIQQALALAARAAGAGEILASDEVARALGRRLVGERGAGAVGGVVVAGLEGAGVGAAPALVGRRAELALMVSLLETCTATGRGRALLVRGQAGIGKTRLLEALRAQAIERGVAVHGAQALDFGQAAGQRLIASLTCSLLGAGAEAPPVERAAAVRRAVDAGAIDEDAVLFLSELAGAPVGDELRPLQAALDAAARQRGRSAVLARLLAAAAARAPRLILVEDLHWSDAEERGLLADLAAAGAASPVLMVLTTRPDGDPLDAGWRARARGCPLSSIDLAPLDAAEARALAIAAHPELAAATIESCVARADGVPLFLEQLLRAAAAGRTALPGSVRALVLARLDRLDRPARELCHAAATLGQRAPRAAVDFILGADAAPPARADAAADLLRPEGDELVFTHALFRDAIHESLLRSNRQRLHGRAAAWFAERDPALAAGHLDAAEDPAAADAYLRAARAEAAAQRPERALACAQRAQALARAPAAHHAASCLLGELLLHAGRINEALAAFRQALELATGDGERAEAWLGVAGALRILDRYDEALAALGEADRALPPDRHLARARLETLRGNVHFPVDVAACLRAHERALAHARAAGSKLDEMRATGGLGDAHYQRGAMRTAGKYFAACVAECRRGEHLGPLLGHLPMLALTRAYAGDLAGALADCRESLALAARVGNARAELLVEICTACVHGYRGEAAQALERAERSLTLARQLGARRFETEALGLVAAALLDLAEDAAPGDAAAAAGRDRAISLLRAASEQARGSNAAYAGPAVLGLLARAARAPEERAAALAEAMALVERSPVTPNTFELHANAIDAALADERWPAAREHAAALEAATAAEPLPWSDLIIRRARLLADAGERGTGLDPDAAPRLRGDIERAGFRALLRHLS